MPAAYFSIDDVSAALIFLACLVALLTIFYLLWVWCGSFHRTKQDFEAGQRGDRDGHPFPVPYTVHRISYPYYDPLPQNKIKQLPRTQVRKARRMSYSSTRNLVSFHTMLRRHGLNA